MGVSPQQSPFRLTPASCVGGQTGPHGYCRRMWQTGMDWEQERVSFISKCQL